MASLEYFLVSRSVSVDQETNQVSIFDVIEEASASKFPSNIPNCVAISLWRKDPREADEEMQVMLNITLPDGKAHKFPINFQMKNRRHRIIQRMEGLPIPKEGEIRFEVSLNGEHAATHIVDVKLIEAGDADEVPHKTDENAGSEDSSD